MPDLPMSGRVALVAGASRGIGAATAEAFAAAGAAVVLGARDMQALESVAARIESRGGRAIAVRTDVADTDSMRNLVDQGLAAYGRLDAAFNNAASGPMPAPLADIDPDEFDGGTRRGKRLGGGGPDSPARPGYQGYPARHSQIRHDVLLEHFFSRKILLH